MPLFLYILTNFTTNLSQNRLFLLISLEFQNRIWWEQKIVRPYVIIFMKYCKSKSIQLKGDIIWEVTLFLIEYPEVVSSIREVTLFEGCLVFKRIRYLYLKLIKQGYYISCTNDISHWIFIGKVWHTVNINLLIW